MPTSRERRTDAEDRALGLAWRRPALFDGLACAAILLLCAAVYGATLNSEFVFDDGRRIEQNSTIQLDSLGLDQLLRVARNSGNRPIAYLTFALNDYAGQSEVMGYRLVNLFVHATNGLLVYALGLVLFGLPASSSRRSGPPSVRPAALLAALLFTVHPVQTQAVTYVVQRITSLAVLFCLLAFLLFLLGRLESSRRPRLLYWSAALAAWILALGTKEISACLPVIVVLAEWFFFRDLDWGWIRRQLHWMALAAILVGVVAWIYLDGDFSLPSYEKRDFTLSERLLTQPRVVFFYLGLVFFPHPSRLSVSHAFETSHSLVDPGTTVVSIGGLLLVVIAAACLARRERLLSFFSLWFFVTLVIESSVIPIEMVFEHRLYFPLVGVSLAFGWLFWRALGRRPLWATFLAAVLVVALGVATVDRNRVWLTRVSLWSDAALKNPADARAHYNLAIALKRAGRLDESIPRLDEALRLRPTYFEGHMGLGLALSEQGDNEAAIRKYREALRVEPDHPQRELALTNIGVSLQLLGRLEEAEMSYRDVLRAKPDAVASHYNLGTLLQATERLDEARVHYELALEITSNYTDPLIALGYLSGRDGNFAEAARRFEAVLHRRPDDARAHKGLGFALAYQGLHSRASVHLIEALRISPDDPETRKALEALQQYERAGRAPVAPGRAR